MLYPGYVQKSKLEMFPGKEKYMWHTFATALFFTENTLYNPVCLMGDACHP